MATFEELANKLEEEIHSFSNFIIGKTGLSIVDRFNESYCNNYKKYKVVAYSKNYNTIEDFEMYLLQRFNELDICDNTQLNNQNITESEHYILYLMYN